MKSNLCVLNCAPAAYRCGLLGLFLLLVSGNLAAANEAQPTNQVRTFLESNCYDCHQGESADAGLDLEKLTFDLGKGNQLDRWVRIYDRVESGEMPPAEYGELDPGDKSQFLNTTHQGVIDFQTKLHTKYGRVRGRRLTRKQIERSLQDLLAIDIPLLDFLPEEAKTEGFTTVAEGQGMSHFQIAAHLNTVDAALDEAFRRALSPEDQYQRDFDAQGVARTNPKRRCREPEMRKGKAVIWSSGLIYYGRMPATTAPADGWYQFAVTVSGLKLPKTGGVWSTVRSGPCVSTAPLLSDIATFEAMEQPKTVEFVAWLPKGHMLEIRPGDGTLKKGRFAGGQVGVGEGEDQELPGLAFERVTMERIHQNGDDAQVRQALFGDLKVEPNKDKKKSWKVTSEHPQQDAEKLLLAFASRAYRRPVKASEIEPYAAEVREALENKAEFVDALRLGYRALLCSPRFLYFAEEPGPLDDYEVATRVSYLLTGSTPDAKLTQLAAEGKLHDREVLKEEVRRLLQGKRGEQFLRDLAAEWLDLDQIDFTQPDAKLYRGFDPIVERAMLAETEAYLQTMLEKNLSVTYLIDSDFTYLNSRLARYYEIDGIEGDTLRRVKIPPKSHRGGLLTQGAIMKVTANGTTTSPVVRGVWVSERLLGVDVPAPPSNVPAVEPDIRGAKTIREQLAKHRSQGECASCHTKIDPAGFALENFDPSGRWRDNYLTSNGRKVTKGQPIDASYELPDGKRFENIQGFQKIVTGQPQRLAANVAEKLLVYGTGATIEFADRAEVERIAQLAAAEDYGFRTIIEEVVVSPLFLSK
ncbi:DUF1592 domain-containing protein [Blastopirellula marina]|uniref:Cytochrome c domain-containing protein n=1 Tax=Blastopirellula marina TaxID=124 RepID=A0A2S8F9G3_9BACT|nr:DUF1592 domain-containing protein [Blastopirellula marina]PQO28806.1 hypothetical protein C5Y98_23815 [Blastopirellula marina]PTL42079.1 DUF1592 domain-containing protein [Blastopirellula marina]